MCGNCEYERKEFFKMELNSIEIKKDLYKNKSVAFLHRYESGNLWYRIQTTFGNFEFPISTVEYKEENFEMIFSKEIGHTAFYNEIKASELNRWIERSIKEQTILPYYN